MRSAAPAEAGAPPDTAARAPRRVGGGFLAGAGGRLLPPSVPLRWFAAAALFHALAWLALAAGASEWPAWRGGLGWPLAALHLVTVGTLLASAIGASLQLLPVASRQPVRWPALAALAWWLFLPGVALLALGMGLARPPWLAAGAALLITVLGCWGALLALNLIGARGMPGVVLHGWAALGSLVLLLASAAVLVAWWNGLDLGLPRDAARGLHGAAGVFGVMGLLVLGLSTVLLPMFVIGPVPEEAAQRRWGLLAIAGVVLLATAALVPTAATGLRGAALAAAAAVALLHGAALRRMFASAMRPALGRAGTLMKLGWGCAALAAIAAAVALVAPEAAAAAAGELFLLLSIGGWLLSFLFGVLHRVLPFLAAMHALPEGAAGSRRRRPPTPSSLAWEAPLAWQLPAHAAALVLLALALLTRDSCWLLAAAASGFAGGVAFALFFVVLVLRLVRARRGAT